MNTIADTSASALVSSTSCAPFYAFSPSPITFDSVWSYLSSPEYGFLVLKLVSASLLAWYGTKLLARVFRSVRS